MEKRKFGLVAAFVLQLILLLAANRFFVNDMREDIDGMRRELTSGGMPAEQVNTVADALSKVRTNVSSYVLMTTVFLVGLNASVAQLVNRKEDH